jgi:glycerol-3-phosphate acyltransferase PlsY
LTLLLDLPFDPTPSPAQLWWLPLAAYLLGSLPFGYLIVRLRGRGDIRGQGSGSIGTTNVARRAGIAAGLLTLLLDCAKGYFAVWIAARASQGSSRWMMLAGLLAIAGHIFPIWLGFHGGRGVAPGLGVFLFICWKAALVALVVWILVVVFWRYISLGSICAAASLPALVYLLYAPPHAPPAAITAGSLTAIAMVIWRHQDNITRLLQGAEPQIILPWDHDSPR